MTNVRRRLAHCDDERANRLDRKSEEDDDDDDDVHGEEEEAQLSEAGARRQIAAIAKEVVGEAIVLTEGKGMVLGDT